ncbi:glycoside hydrolase family 3 N-terminal domain-containing protein [Massilia sp. IC2-476]|uniref:glycoside hydrolase family 3 N-terminal domain-containing protein n=1 Tax=Massilia sp. IC2-476 TaxID=2887199 RepID=UPI001D108EF8|nr:glycoside hydrolase family 3 N-terminal domain-containing protein [Massilia sp. IC2-476]MCC2973914.1 glycoside hydrolase family 3 C-terminal domain-containing protein [Massilia sp. IC2-476]
MGIKRREFLASVGSMAGIAGLGSVPAVATAAGATRAAPPGAPLYKQAGAPVEARVEDLLRRMTLEEKIAQMQCLWQKKPAVQNADSSFSPDKAVAAYPNGMGMFARPSDRLLGNAANVAGNSGATANRGPRETAEYVNAVQKWAVERTRLGIPVLMHEEALHGYTAREATCFPQAIGLASSFDPALVTQVFSVAAREMRARGANLALAPVVDVARDPRWGRIEETYGEDPHLCGVIGKAAVIGFSGETLPLAPNKVHATLKHMTGHGQPESGTNIGPANVGERALREDFFPPFEKIIKETKIAAVMPSYNEIDGQPSHANRWLLTDVLRKEWGFKGATVSDYMAVNELITRHSLAATPKEAALRAIKAGVDVETPDPLGYLTLAELVREKRISVKEIDDSVRRILRLKFDAGLFENPYADAAKAEALTATPDAIALAREAARRSAVLLKNDKGLLPLQPERVGKMLLLGTHARDTPIGGYSDIPRHVVSVYEGLQKEAQAQGFSLAYAEGVRLTEERIWGKDQIVFTKPDVNARLIAEAVEAAKSADTIVMVLGDNEMTAREAWADNHLGDRTTLDLLGQQNDLARAIFALGKPTVVLLLNGRPLSTTLLAERADALLECWYLGQETGHAVADLLFGRANPGGKLPVTIAREVGQLPMYYNRKPSSRRGYIDGTTSPLYPFGYGLSYTRFEISAPRLAQARIGTAGSTRVEVDVRNVGSLRGDEVVQLYIRDDVSSVTRPLLELKGFQRVSLEPGESRRLSFDIKPSDLWFFNGDMKRVVEPGTFSIFVGPNSVDLKKATLTVA